MLVDGNTLTENSKRDGLRASGHALSRSPSTHASDLLGRVPALLGLSDGLGVAATGLLAGMLVAANEPGTITSPLTVLLAATLCVNCLYLLSAYSVRGVPHTAAQMARASVAWIATFLVLAGIDLASGRGAERFDEAAQLWFGAAWLHLLATRGLVHLQLAHWRRQGRLARKVAVLGAGQPAIDLARRLSAAGETELVGLFVEGEAPDGPNPITGSTDLLVELAAAGRVDEIILASPWPPPRALNEAIGKFAALQTEIKIAPEFGTLKMVPREFGFVADVPTLTLQRRPLSGWGGPAKRIEDVVFGTLMLVALAPLMALIAVIIRLDSRGPVLFRQERYGFNNNRIVVYKFRSMYHQAAADPSVPQAKRHDPRVTRVGAILRRTSLDELPQLLNVLLGDMSLVGPRPHAAAHNETYAKLIDGYLARHRMKPGITGWAQVNGARGETASLHQMQRRLEYDLHYIANWSLMLDFKVLLMTFPAVLRGTNAY